MSEHPGLLTDLLHDSLFYNFNMLDGGNTFCPFFPLLHFTTDAAHFEQSHSCQLLEADLVLERLRNAQDVLCVVTRKEDLISSHIK